MLCSIIVILFYLLYIFFLFFFFFFQAEDGIRDGHVTGVQTCALPIYPSIVSRWTNEGGSSYAIAATPESRFSIRTENLRSEERRVGKECRSRWSPYH